MGRMVWPEKTTGLSAFVSRLGWSVLSCVILLAAAAGSDQAIAEERSGKPTYDSERCERAAKLAKQPIPLPYDPTESTQDVFLRVKGVRYAIPANYFRYPPVGCDTEETGFLLRVLLPDFEGYTEENREAMAKGGTERMYMNIMLQGRVNPDMKSTFLAYAQDVDPEGDYPTWQGLFKSKSFLGDDVYFERKNGRITFVMNCKTKQRFPYPSCTQHFLFKETVVQQFFSRNLQENWRDIRDGTIKLLDRFVEQAAKVN